MTGTQSEQNPVTSVYFNFTIYSNYIIGILVRFVFRRDSNVAAHKLIT